MHPRPRQRNGHPGPTAGDAPRRVNIDRLGSSSSFPKHGDELTDKSGPLKAPFRVRCLDLLAETADRSKELSAAIPS